MDSKREYLNSGELDQDEYERLVREAIEAQDPGPETKRQVEAVRQGMETAFWAWLRETIRADIMADQDALEDPATKDHLIGFLRGKIHAKREILRLPYEYLQGYDYSQTPVGETEEALVTPGASRPLSPISEEMMNDG